MPLTIERYRAEHANEGADRRSECWVAAVGDRVVGAGSFTPAWWTGNRAIYSAEIRVDQNYWRQGIGRQLSNVLKSRLVALEATRVTGWVRVDASPGRHFATDLGFRETGRVLEEYSLHVPEASTDRHEGLEERLQREGLQIATLAELGVEDETFLRALQRLWADSSDIPSMPEPRRKSIPSWQIQVLRAPGLSPETHWIALDGKRPVGMTFLKRLSADSAENAYTGVATTYRGRGIAPALKLQAIAWAHGHGVDWFHTASVLTNSPMLGINRRLGYRPGVQRAEIVRDL